jgi:hypothetical protein
MRSGYAASALMKVIAGHAVGRGDSMTDSLAWNSALRDSPGYCQFLLFLNQSAYVERMLLHFDMLNKRSNGNSCIGEIITS